MTEKQKSSTTEVVLDASAILALLGGERGFEKVQAVLPCAIASAVNVAEVVGKLAERGMPVAEIRHAIKTIGLSIVPFSEQHAYLAGQLRPQTQHLGLSLGDRACLALGQDRHALVLTADTRWTTLTMISVNVESIR